MAIKNETAGIVLPVSLEPNTKSFRSVTSGLKDIDQTSRSTARSLRKVAQASQTNIAAINELSGVAKHFSKSFSKSALEAASEFSKLHDEIAKTAEEVDKLQDQLEHASDEAKPALKGKIAHLEKSFKDLNHEVDKTKVKYKKQITEITSTSGKIHKVGKKLEGFAGTKTDFGGALKKLLSGDIKGGAGGIASSAAKAAQAGAGRSGGAALGAGDAAAAESMVAVAGGIAAAAAAFAVFIKLISAASNHMTTLNKALISGTTLGDDFGMTAGQYRKSLGEIRRAVVSTSGSFLALGATSEDRLKAMGAFAKEASGSIGYMNTMLKNNQVRSITVGAEEFSKNAILYGKALGTNAEDVAGMMGKWVTDIGYGADNVQQIMSGVVKMAVTSNMPVHRFMDIFRQVLPSVDLYINRMEELTGVIKVLSKTMSAESVKKFMGAFSQGFDKMDFKSRLGLYFKAGPQKVRKTTGEDQANQAASISSQFSAMGKEFQDRLEKAIKAGNTDTVAAMMGPAGAGGVASSAIEAALQTSRYAKAHKQGGPIQDTFAMRGMGAYGRYKTLQDATQFAKVDMFSGMGEHIAKQNNISEDMYDGLMKMDSSMKVWAKQVQRTGITSSDSINKQMRAAVEGKTGKKFGSDKEVEDWMKKQDQKTIQDVILRASSMDQALTEKQKKSMEELAEEQTTQTKSVGEKIENIIGYFLEKIYQVLNDEILGVLNDLWGWSTSNSATRETTKALIEMGSHFDELAKIDETSAENFKTNNDVLTKLSSSGANSQEIYNQSQGLIMKDKKGFDDAVAAILGEAGGGDEYAHRAETGGDTATFIRNMDPNDLLRILGTQNLRTSTNDAATAFATGKATKKVDLHRRPGSAPISEKQKSDTSKDYIERERALGTYIPEKTGTGAEDTAEAVSTTAEQTQITADSVAATEGHADKANKISEKEQKAVEHMDKTGMKMDKGFLNNEYYKIIKTATYESFSRALVEFSTVLAKILNDPAFAQNLMAGAGNITATQGGISMIDLVNQPNLTEYAGAMLPQRQHGGDISETGAYMLHAGEHVLSPTDTASFNQRGSGSTVINANFNINGANDPKQTAREVHRILHHIATRQ